MYEWTSMLQRDAEPTVVWIGGLVTELITGILIPKEKVLGDGAIRKELDPKDSTFLMGSVSLQRLQERCLLLSALSHVRTQHEMAVTNQPRGLS